MKTKIKPNQKRERVLKGRKAQFYLIELVVAVILIAAVILVFQTIQTTQYGARIQRRSELREIGWNALTISDEVDLLRPAVYSKHSQGNSAEILALADFLSLALAPELDYILDAKNQISEDMWNIIGGEKISELGEDRDIVVVAYLVLGNSHTHSSQSVLDPVIVILSLWYAT